VGGLDSTAKQLVTDGYLTVSGAVTRGRRKPSPIYAFVCERTKELEAAALASSVHRIEAGSELLLIPARSIPLAAPALRTAGPEVLWAARTGESAVGLVVIVDAKADISARDALLHALHPAGAERITANAVLDREALDTYCDRLVDAQPRDLPTIT
jgi:hypothetical protein